MDESIYALNAEYDAMQYEIARLETENAKLREQIRWLKQGDILHVLTDQEYIDQCERERLMQVSIDALDKENAKLRDLAKIAIRCITDVPDCDSCALGEQVTGVWVCHFIGAANELGVEVDE